MDNLAWRSRAKIVACIDIVLSFLGFLALAVFMFFAVAIITGALVIGNGPKTLKGFSKQGFTGNLNAAAGFVWLVVAFCAFCTGLQMWAAVKLLESTKRGIHPGEAFTKARSWRNVNFALFVVSIGAGVVTWCWVFIIISLWYGTALSVVYKFMKELQFVLAFQSGRGNKFPVGVVINKC